MSNLKVDLSVLKIIPNKYQFLLKFMLILNVFLKIETLVLIISVFHTQGNIKTMFHAVLLIKLSVLIIDLVKGLCWAEEKMQLINLLRWFLMSTIIVKEL